MRVLLLFLILLVACDRHQPPSYAQAPVEVCVYQIEVKRVPIDYSFVGVVQSSHQVQILSSVQGELDRIAFTDGAFVNKGDLLFQIDDRRYRARVQEAEADLDAQNAALTSAKLSLNRLAPLLEESAVSQKDVDDATSQVLTAQAGVNKAKAALDVATLDLNDTSILSPISGFISSAQFQEGTLIIPNCTTSLASVSVLDPIYVELSSSEGSYLKIINEVKSGELALPENSRFDVVLILDNGMEFPYTGVIDFVSPVFKADVGALISRASFPNPEYLLKPGLFVQAVVKGMYRPHAILVPQEAVQQGVKGLFVYVVDEDSKVEMRSVSLDEMLQGYWVVKSGLKQGDRVIVSGAQKVKNGSLVRVKKKCSF